MAVQQRGYEQQVSPAGAPGFSQAGPDAFGSQVGAAIGESEQVYRKIRADQDSSSFNAAFAKARLENDKTFTDLQNSVPPNGAGYSDAVTSHLDQQQDQVLAGIRDPHVRRAAQAQWEDYVAQQGIRANTWQAGKAAINTLSDAKLTISASSGRVLNSPDPNAYADESGHIESSVQSLQGIDADAKVKLAQEWHQQLAVANNGRLVNTNPAAAVAAIDAGAYNGIGFTPEQLQAMRRQGEVAVARQQSQAKAAQAQANEIERKSIAADTATLKLGRGTPDEWNAIAQRNVAIGDQAQAVEARAQAIEIGSAEGYRGATPLQRQARIDELAAKPERSAEEGAELKGLQGQQDYVNKLPALQRSAYATGTAFAPIDWNDPDSIKARALQVQAAQQHFGGKPDFLLPGEEQPLKELIASPQRADHVAAAQAILAAGQYSGAILNQVAPNDRAFRSAIGLAALPNGATLMDKALKAPEAERSNPAIFTPPKTATGKEGPKFNEVYAGTIGQAAEWLNPSARAAIFDNTRALYAATAGDQGWSIFHAGEAQRQLNVALGGVETPRGWAGGLGRWNGAATILPQGMRQDDFDRRMSRSTVADWGAAGRNGAPWVASQNRTMTPREIRSLVPTMVADGVYRLRQGNNTFVMTKDGRPYEFDVRKLHGTAATVSPQPSKPVTPYYLNRPGYQPVSGG